MERRTAHLSRVAIVMTMCCVFAARGTSQSSLPFDGRIVAAEGLPVSSLPGVTFGGAQTFDLPVIDEHGVVAFRGRMTGIGVTALDDRAVFEGTVYWDLTVVARGGDPAPGLSGLSLTTGSAPGIGGTIRMSPGGDVMFGSFLGGPGVTATNDTALFAESSGALVPVVREGDPAPGTGGAFLSSSFSNPFASAVGLNRSGRTVFQSALVGGDTTSVNDVAWFGGMPQTTDLIQRKGDVVIGGLGTIGALGTLCQVNDFGQVLHSASLVQGGVVGTGDDETVWIHTPGLGDVLVLREGDPAPGTIGAQFGNPANTWTANIGSNAFNRLGQFAFVSELVGGDVAAGINDRAVMIGSQGGISLVCRKGEPAPGTNAVFATMSAGGLSINGAGSVLFQSTISGGTTSAADDTGIWSGSAGALVLIAREGNPAPNAGGALFGSLSGSQMHLNDRGQILFTTLLTGAGVTGPGNNTALYSYDPVVGLELVLRGADVVMTSASVAKTVSSFALVSNNGGDGATLAFNHAGDFVLRASMTDGTSAIIAGHVGTLSGEPRLLSAGTGGIQTLRLKASPARAGQAYFLGGSASGTLPGFNAGGIQIPLNPDLYFLITIQLANSVYFTNTLGFLDQNGEATATLWVPPGFPGIAGVVLHHAFGTYDPSGSPSMVSEPAVLSIGL